MRACAQRRRRTHREERTFARGCSGCNDVGNCNDDDVSSRFRIVSDNDQISHGRTGDDIDMRLKYIRHSSTPDRFTRSDTACIRESYAELSQRLRYATATAMIISPCTSVRVFGHDNDGSRSRSRSHSLIRRATDRFDMIYPRTPQTPPLQLLALVDPIRLLTMRINGCALRGRLVGETLYRKA